jgi:hypothetical protein
MMLAPQIRKTRASEGPPMKKTVGGVFGVFVVLLVGILVWMFISNRQAESEVAEMKAKFDAGQMIPVTFVVKPPPGTPENQPLYLCGNAPTLGNWEANLGTQLKKRGDGAYEGAVELQRGREYTFKVNRGTWSTVERGPKGEEIPNHAFAAEDKKPVEVQVATWVDEGKSTPGRVTLAGTTIMHPKFPSKGLGNVRDVVVYLPPGYSDSEDARYPVL